MKVIVIVDQVKLILVKIGSIKFLVYWFPPLWLARQFRNDCMKITNRYSPVDVFEHTLSQCRVDKK